MPFLFFFFPWAALNATQVRYHHGVRTYELGLGTMPPRYLNDVGRMATAMRYLVLDQKQQQQRRRQYYLPTIARAQNSMLVQGYTRLNANTRIDK